LGRFINRDPIDERGGLNLYAFVSNNGINRWDYLGMVEDRALGGRGEVELDGDGGAGSYTGDTSLWWQDAGRAGKIVTNPTSDQRAAMDALSRLQAAIQSLAAQIEVKSGFTTTRQAAMAKATEIAGRVFSDPGANISVAQLSNGQLSVGTQSDHLLNDMNARLDAAGLGNGNAANSGGNLKAQWAALYSRTPMAGPRSLRPGSGLTGEEILTDVISGASTNLSLKGGADAAYVVGASGNIDRTVNGGTAKIDAIAGMGATAYAGVEGKLWDTGTDSTFSFGGKIAVGPALGFDVDVKLNPVTLYVFQDGSSVGFRYPTLPRASFFFGAGIGLSGKLSHPDPSLNLGTLSVDNKGNYRRSGPLSGLGGHD